MAKPPELLLTSIVHAIVKGYSYQTIFDMLKSEGLPEQEMDSLVELANSGAREALKQQNVFLTGDTDRKGFLRWQQPQHLLCSDNMCPCTDKKHLKIGESAYLYISEEVVKLRKNYITLLDIQIKLLSDAKNIGSTAIQVTQGIINPIVLCEIGATQRGLDLAVALEDAKRWYENGFAPLRATPLKPQQKKEVNKVEKKEPKKIIICTTCRSQIFISPDKDISFSCPECGSEYEYKNGETILLKSTETTSEDVNKVRSILEENLPNDQKIPWWKFW